MLIRFFEVQVQRQEEIEALEQEAEQRHQAELDAAVARHPGDGVPSGVDPADALAQLRNGTGSVPPPARPTARAAPKIGRNDPCPCGSGKKFKQCHGRAFDDDDQPTATA